MTDLASKVRRIKSRYEDCFGCGSANPFGLRLGGFTLVDDETVRAPWSPRPEYRGFAGVLHGGIVTAALDEMMAWTAMLLADVTVVTGTMDLRFASPAPVAATYTLEGRLLERRGRRLIVEGSCLDEDERAVATAKAMFVATAGLG